MKRISLLPKGSVSDDALQHLIGNNPDPFELYHFRLISDIFSATANGQTDLSVIPIENTIDGSVNPHVDWLVHEMSLPIQAEWIYPSVQNLIGRSPKIDLRTIRKVISIPVAIAQCGDFLREHLPDVEFDYVNSTTEGILKASEAADDGVAAIGTARAAGLYGMHVLAANITDHHNNFTRFILVGPDPVDLQPTEQYKTTILVTLPEDFPGALHQVLSAFAWRKINLSKIESRPTKKRLGSYYFYIDIEGRMNSVLLPAALEEITAIGCQVRILGSYPCYPYVNGNC